MEKQFTIGLPIVSENHGVSEQLTLFDGFAGADQRHSSPTTEFERPPIAVVNRIQCAVVGQRLIAATCDMQDSFALKSLPTLDQTRALLHVVGICDRLNWDFVLGSLSANLWDSTDGFRADRVLRLSERDFRVAFGGYKRSDGGIRYRKKLTNLQGIAKRATELDTVRALTSCDLVNGDNGARAVICNLPAYNADPLAKKCNALLHELVRRDLVHFSDANSIDPAIDYHVMRLYLRTGRVMIVDDDLRSRLIERRRVRIEAITEIRRVVAEAVKYSAWLHNVTVSRLNEIEWAFARRSCRRDQVVCTQSGASCPLGSVCPSAGMRPFEIVTEPDSRHGHY